MRPIHKGQEEGLLQKAKLTSVMSYQFNCCERPWLAHALFVKSLQAPEEAASKLPPLLKLSSMQLSVESIDILAHIVGGLDWWCGDLNPSPSQQTN